MSAFTVGSIKSNMRFDYSEFSRGMRDVYQGAGSIKKSMESIGASAFAVGRDLSIAGGAVTAFFAGTVKLAAEAEESTNLFTVSMGGAVEATRNWSNELSDQLGVSALSIQNVTGNLNVIVKNMGLTEQASASMSKELTKLAFDMGSFYNLPHEAALEKLRSGIVGESEPLKQLGIVISEARVQAFAFENGIASIGEQMNEAQKTVARYGLIMKLTGDAQGDLARTGGSLTNQTRRITDQLKDLAVTTGNVLIPVITRLADNVNVSVQGFKQWTKEHQELFSEMVKTSAGAGIVVSSMGGMALGIAGVARAYDVLRNSALLAWAAVTGPATIVVAEIGTIGAALYVLRANWINIEKAARDATGGIKQTLDDLLAKVKAIGTEILSFFTGIWDGVAAGAKRALSFVGLDGVVGDAMDKVKGVGSGLSRVTDMITRPFKAAVGEIKSIFSGDLKSTGFIEDLWASVVTQFNADISKSPALKDFLDLMTGKFETPDFEGYFDFDPAKLLEGVEATDNIGKAAKEAAAALASLKDAALDMRLSLYPEEQFAADVKRVTDLAEAFPGIIDNGAVARAFDDLLKGFEGKGLDAVKVLESGLLSIPPVFEQAMIAAAARAKTASIEAMMEAKAAAEDSREIADRANTLARGANLFQSLADPAGLQGILNNTEDLTAKMRDLIDAGDISQAGSDNLFSRSAWDTVLELGTYSLDAITRSLMTVTNEGTKIPDMLKEFAAHIPKAALFQVLARDIGSVGEKMKALGANNIGNVLTGFTNLYETSLKIVREIKAIPDLFRLMESAGVATAIKIGIAMHFALNVIALIADAVILVISLFSKWGKEGEQELKGIAKVIDEIKEASNQWIDTLSDKFIEFIRTGTANWREFVDQILNDILKISIRELLIQPAFSFIGSAFADGGAFNKGHFVTSPELFSTKDGPGLRGEAGTEVVMPAVRMADGTLGVKAGGGGSMVVNILDQRTGDQPPVQHSVTRGPDGGEIHNLIITSVIKGMLEGDFDRSLQLISPRMS